MSFLENGIEKVMEAAFPILEQIEADQEELALYREKYGSLDGNDLDVPLAGIELTTDKDTDETNRPTANDIYDEVVTEYAKHQEVKWIIRALQADATKGVLARLLRASEDLVHFSPTWRAELNENTAEILALCHLIKAVLELTDDPTYSKIFTIKNIDKYLFNSTIVFDPTTVLKSHHDYTLTVSAHLADKICTNELSDLKKAYGIESNFYNLGLIERMVVRSSNNNDRPFELVVNCPYEPYMTDDEMYEDLEKVTAAYKDQHAEIWKNLILAPNRVVIIDAIYNYAKDGYQRYQAILPQAAIDALKIVHQSIVNSLTAEYYLEHVVLKKAEIRQYLVDKPSRINPISRLLRLDREQVMHFYDELIDHATETKCNDVVTTRLIKQRSSDLDNTKQDDEYGNYLLSMRIESPTDVAFVALDYSNPKRRPEITGKVIGKTLHVTFNTTDLDVLVVHDITKLIRDRMESIGLGTVFIHRN